MTETRGTGASVRRVADRELPSFDLVVATVDRVAELGHLLRSLENQTYRAFRIILVDQNHDNRLESLLGEHRSLEVVRLRAEQRGLSRARNAALELISADFVAFPDDDCIYPADLLARVARRFADEPRLDGLTGRAADPNGSSNPSWAREGAILNRDNLWNRAISYTIFLRAPVIRNVSGFDEHLGLGSGEAWASGEEIDLLLQALEQGARIEFDPDLVVIHDEKAHSPEILRALGARDGASIGYLLRKHGYPRRAVVRMLVRPLAGAAFAFVRADISRTRFQLSTLAGRLRGYRAA